MRHSGPATLQLPDGAALTGMVGLMIGDDPDALGRWEGVFRPAGDDPFELPPTEVSLTFEDGRVGHVLVHNAERDSHGALMLHVIGSGPGGDDIPR